MKIIERLLSIAPIQKTLQIAGLYSVSGPQFIIVGASKAGSTTLYSLLAKHPKVVTANGVLRQGKKIVKTHNKEIRFFNRVDHMSRRNIWAYQRLFLPDFLTKGMMTFEATPNYLSSGRAPKNIYEYSSNMKLIMCLREPSERAYSQWKMFHTLPPQNSIHESRSFQEVIDNKESSCVKNGLYAEQIKRYLDFFDPGQLLILDFNQLRVNQNDLLLRLTEFLGLEEFEIEEVHSNFGRSLKDKVKEHETALAELKRYYKPHNDELQKLLGQLNVQMSWL